MLIGIEEYVLGFCFNREKNRVVLMEKNRPDWQKGKLNGVGGKKELGETPIEAMCREFEEETGVKSSVKDWNYCIELSGVFHKVHIYRAMDDWMFENVTTKTDEEILQFPTWKISSLPIIDNLQWILPMLKDGLVDFPMEINYDSDPMRRMANCDHAWIYNVPKINK